MATDASNESQPPAADPLSRVRWILRITVLLQAIGIWISMTQVDDSPLFELLWLPRDAGGYAWLEADALEAQTIVGWTALACGLLTVVRPAFLWTGGLALLQVTLTVAMWRGDTGYSLAGPWPTPDVKRLFPFATEALQMATPAVLLLVDPWLVQRAARFRWWLGGTLLRLAAAATFAAIGVEAGQHQRQLTDAVAATAARFWIDVSRARIEELLTIVGVVHLLAAAVCLVVRSRVIVAWMVLWSVAAVVICLASSGIHLTWYELLAAAGNLGGPLALFVLWHVAQRRSTLAPVAASDPPPMRPEELA